MLPWWYATKDEIPDHLAEHEGVTNAMDELHLRKIDLATEIFIVNQDDYIGDSTRKEIEYAMSKGLKLRWYSHDPIGEMVQSLVETAHKTWRRDLEDRNAILGMVDKKR